MLNYPLCALRGLHLRRCGSPDAINPGLVHCHPRSAQGRYGGAGSCPLLDRTSLLNFIVHKCNFPQKLNYPGMVRDFFSPYSLYGDCRRPANGRPRGGSGTNNSKKPCPLCLEQDLRRVSLVNISIFMVLR